jgi:hypothetical protein
MSFDRLRAAKRPREEAFLSPVTLAFSLSIARICTDERRVRNSILTHTALYRYQPAEQIYCYVRHYGTGQASAESDDLADLAEEPRPGKRLRVEDAPEDAQQVA